MQGYKTLFGLLLVLAFQVLAIAGVSVDAETQKHIIDSANLIWGEVGTLAGLILAVYGRFKASTKVGGAPLDAPAAPGLEFGGGYQPTSNGGTPAAPPKNPNAGFARLGVMLLLASLSLTGLLSACASTQPTPNALNVAAAASPAQAAQAAINEGLMQVIVVGQLTEQDLASGLITAPESAARWAQIKTQRENLRRAQAALDLGNVGVAGPQAEAARALLTDLRRQVRRATATPN